MIVLLATAMGKKRNKQKTHTTFPQHGKLLRSPAARKITKCGISASMTFNGDEFVA